MAVRPLLGLKSLSILIFIHFVRNGESWIFRRGKKPLAINGEWSNWSNWTVCHENDENREDYFAKWKGFTVATKSRSCDSPRPLNGGQDCTGSKFRYKQCGCYNALGLENGRIGDEQLASSSELSGYEARYGRLKSSAAWCAKSVTSLFSDVYFQIEFKNVVKIDGLTTEGISRGRVTRYRLEHSLSGERNSWTLYRHSNRGTGEITGNLRYGPKSVRLIHSIITKYVRLYPLHSFGDACMKVEFFGCEFTCGHLYTKPSGRIVGHSSPEVDQNCRWRITVANTTMVTLDFDILQIPCEYGYVEAWDASKAQSGMVPQRKHFCGTRLPPPFKFPGNDLWITFVSSSWEDEHNFILRYTTTCERDADLSNLDEFDVLSPGYPNDYPHNSECRWNIASQQGNLIEAQFLDFDVEESNSTDYCANDMLQMAPKGGQNETYCNTRRPPKSILYSSTLLTITFKSDSFIVGRGFKIRLRSFDPSTRTTKQVPITHPVTVSTFPKTNSLGPDITEKRVTPTNSTEMTYKPTMPGNQLGLDGTNSSNFQRKRTKDSDDSDDTWTIIIVAAFSCIVIVLIVIVGTINIYRCIHGRNIYAFANAKLEQTNCSSQKSTNPKQDAAVRIHLLTVEADGNVSPSLGSPLESRDVDNEIEVDVIQECKEVKCGKSEGCSSQEPKGNGKPKVSPLRSQVSSEESSACDYVDCPEESDAKLSEFKDVPEIDHVPDSDLQCLPDCAESNV